MTTLNVSGLGPCRQAAAALLAFLALARSALPGAPAPLPLVDESGRPPHAIVRESVQITVGRTTSLVEGTFEYVYVPAFDSKDHLDPVLIDVPVVVSEKDATAAAVLKIANVRLTVGSNAFFPRDVLMLDHTILDPVPLIPDGSRIAIVSFNIPRKALKPRFRVRIAYDQPHVPDEAGNQDAVYVPFLPDFDQLRRVMHFKPDDFLVTFSAGPGVSLHRESINAEIAREQSDRIAVRPRHREAIVVAVQATPAQKP